MIHRGSCIIQLLKELGKRDFRYEYTHCTNKHSLDSLNKKD